MSPLNRFFAFALVAISLPTGCALSTTHVRPSPIDTNVMASARGRGREVIIAAPFDDARDDKHRCGLKRNGFGLETADVICDVPAGRWVADELAERLTREGYRVLSAEAVPGPATIVVRGTLKKLFVEPTATHVRGDAMVDLVVTTASGFRSTKTVDVRVKRPAMITAEDPLEEAAHHATRHLAVDMATAIGDLLEPHPDLGAPGATKLAVAARGR